MTKLQVLVVTALVALSLAGEAVLAQGPGNFPPMGGPGGPPGMMAPPGGPPPPAGVGSAPTRASEADQPPVGLRLVRQADVTPTEVPCVRPGLVRAGGTLYVAYTEMSRPRTRRLLQLDADLKPVRVFALETTGGEPTDMRWIGDEDGMLWSAYETSSGGERSATALNLACYQADAGNLKPGQLERGIASGTMVAPPRHIPPPGAEITDDPAPFLFDGAFVVGTRRFDQAVLPLRTYPAAGGRPAPFDLDLRALFPDRSLSVYSLVSIEGRPWLLAGVQTSPRASAPAADIYAVPLQQDLRRADGAAVPLVATPAYETYVSGARYAAGRLALVHLVQDLSPPGRFEGHLRVFDVARGFAQVGHAVINVAAANQQVDNHLSIEVAGDRIFVAYYTPQGRLMVREYAPDGP